MFYILGYLFFWQWFVVQWIYQELSRCYRRRSLFIIKVSSFNEDDAYVTATVRLYEPDDSEDDISIEDAKKITHERVTSTFKRFTDHGDNYLILVPRNAKSIVIRDPMYRDGVVDGFRVEDGVIV